MFKVGEEVYLAKNVLHYVRGTKAFIKKIESNTIVLEIIEDENEIEVGYYDVLKSCPFCGGEPLLSIYLAKYVKVVCSNCAISTPKVYASVCYTAVDEAIECWNRRA